MHMTTLETMGKTLTQVLDSVLIIPKILWALMGLLFDPVYWHHVFSLYQRSSVHSIRAVLVILRGKAAFTDNLFRIQELSSDEHFHAAQKSCRNPQLVLTVMSVGKETDPDAI